MLRARQAETLAAHAPRLGRLGRRRCRTGPRSCVANEFFDALPIRQFQRLDALWRERLVGLDGGAARRRSGARRGPTPSSTRAFRWCATARSSRSRRPARRWRRRSARRIAADGRRGADRRLRRLGRHRRHAAGAARARAGRSAGRAGRGRPDRACRLPRRSPRPRGRRGRWGPLAQGVFLERLGITARARALARAGRRGGRGGGRGPSALDPPGGNGKPPPGSGADAGGRPDAARDSTA